MMVPVTPRLRGGSKSPVLRLVGAFLLLISSMIAVSSATNLSPVQASGTSSVSLSDGLSATQVAVGRRHSCALSEGSVYCWGQNFDGQLGNGQSWAPDFSTRGTFPVKVLSVSGGFTNAGVTMIAAGELSTCAVESGSVYCWGWNDYGQLGDGTTTSANTPVKVADNTASGFVNSNITAITVGDHFACAVRHGNKLFCWGINDQNQLGQASATTECAGFSPTDCEKSAVSVSAQPDFANDGNETVSSVSASEGYACAVVNGTVVCWGSNASGKLGRGVGMPANSLPAASVSANPNVGFTNSGVSTVSAGPETACAIERGVLFCWGSNYSGALGIGNGTSTGVGDNPLPTKVAANQLSGFVNASVSAVSIGGIGSGIGGYTACAIADGVAYCWGGDGGVTKQGERLLSLDGPDTCATVDCAQTPVKVSEGEMINTSSSAGTHDTIAVGRTHACAIKSSTVFCWGEDQPQLGLAGFFLRFNDPPTLAQTPWMVYRTAQPSVSAITPTSFGTNDTVTLSGTNLQSSTRVSIGSNVCDSVTVNGAGTELTCTFGNTQTFAGNGLVVQNPRRLNAFAPGEGRPAPAHTWTGQPTGGSTGSPSGGSTGSTSGGSSVVVPEPTTTTTEPAPVGVGESDLVTEERQEQLTAPAGDAKMLIGGELVDVELTQAPSELRATAPAERTAAQVSELQTLATTMVAELQAVLGVNATLPSSVRNTPTGAVIVGLARNPITGEPMDVPVEHVVLVSGGGLVLMGSGVDGEQTAKIGLDGALEIPEGGHVSVIAGGLTPGDEGEVIVMSTPQLISSFAVGTSGEVAEQAALPTDLPLGDHTVVVTVGDEAASLGFRLVAATTPAEGTGTGNTATLPATGSNGIAGSWALLFAALGALALLVSTRRRIA